MELDTGSHSQERGVPPVSSGSPLRVRCVRKTSKAKGPKDILCKCLSRLRSGSTPKLPYRFSPAALRRKLISASCIKDLTLLHYQQTGATPA
ncbi:hypothetical protein CHARACLAT_027672 [Characodon lateralis]|uniref:Uncharacterized protein n=1 Tax=Characodon lateralis TaxID=208331 RepID=A0ABU7D190_9TELE|nr:hypothetical protein [Characodon lateralis]